MPVVPRYSQQPIREQGIPNVRLPVDAPAEAFGGGQSAARLTEAASGVAETFKRVQIEEKRKADDLVTQSLYSDALMGLNDLKYNPENGLMTYTGEKAFAAPDEFQGRFQKLVSDLESRVVNDSQREVFARMKAKLAADFDGDLKRHVFNEQKRFEVQRTEANIQSLQEDAALNYQTPGKVQENLGLLTALVQQRAQAQGFSPEQTALALNEVTSRTHLSVLNRILFNRDETTARQYYEENRDAFSVTDSRAAEQSFRAFAIEKNRLEREQKEVLEQQQLQTQDAFLKKLTQDKLTPDEVLRSNLNPFGSGSKDQFLRLIQAEGRQNDDETFNELFRRIHLPDGDPEKIIDENELNQYVIGNRLSKANLQWLRDEIRGSHTEEGKDRLALEKGLYKVASRLSKANPLLGVRDPNGEHNLLRFQKFAKEEIRKRIKAGGDVIPLLDPDSKEWLGHQIDRFHRSPQEIIRDMVKFGPGSTPTLPTESPLPQTAPEPDAKKARRPGESAADYLKRMKAGG